MPARIYALAKELKVDSKDLVDLVKKVGITGKGSALASLSDEEAQKVRDHLSGAGKPEPVAAPAATTAPTMTQATWCAIGDLMPPPDLRDLPCAARSPSVCLCFLPPLVLFF